jgi:CRP-like cAMP-binding protein
MTPFDLQDAVRILAESRLFEGLQATSLQSMIGSLKVERWPRGKIVIRSRELTKRFHVLLKGRVKFARHNPTTGRALTLAVLGPGGAFGMDSLRGMQLGGVSTETLDDVIALSGSNDLWSGWARSVPKFREAARRYTDHQVLRLVELTGDIALHDTVTRLARMIVRYSDASGQDSGAASCLILDLSHEELAHMIGSVRVVVSRSLAALKREGVIDVRAKELRILDHAKLLNIAKF